MARFVIDFEREVIELEEKLNRLKELEGIEVEQFKDEIKFLEDQLEKVRKLVYGNLTPWQKVQISRHPDRPRTSDYINHIFSDFTEIHGDRLYGDDPAIIAGFGNLEGKPYCLIGTQKGKNAKSNVVRNFGMPHPEGYRKALRVMRTAEKFGIPVITFIDTPGAFPGIEAEERGQALAIAENILEMSKLKTPVISINIGEGGSGGALALSVCDRLIMLENSYYSVITPEACASILWHDETKASKAAESLKLTAQDLVDLKIADYIVKEPLGGAHRDSESCFYETHKTMISAIKEMGKKQLKPAKIVEERQKRIRNLGKL